jgi:hypothetical protein
MTYLLLLLEFWEAPIELEKDITSQILESIAGQSCELLSCLITFWVKIVSDR